MAGVTESEYVYRLRAFQLARLRFALSRRGRTTDPDLLRLAGWAILSLYDSCEAAGAGAQARDLIRLYHRGTTPLL